MKFLKIEDNIYKKTFHLILNESNADFLNFIGRFHSKDEGFKEVEKLLKDGVEGMCIFSFSPYYYVYVKNFKLDIQSFAVLHHELNHFVDFVLRYVGIGGGINNSEVRAYYYEYIYVKVARAIREHQDKNKATAKKARATKARTYVNSKQTRKRSRDNSKKKG